MAIRYTPSLVLLVALLCAAATVSAQGDTCTTALLVSHGFHHADGPSTGAGTGNINCGSPGGNGDWYKYIPTFTGMINISSCNSMNNNTDDDTYVHVLTGNCDSLICLGYNDDMGSNSCPGYNFATYLDVAVTAGETYYIVWTDSFDSDDFYWNLTECFGTVQGEAFHDNNNNGVRDSLESAVNTMLLVEPGAHYVYAGHDLYSFCTEEGTYTITAPNPPLYHTAVPTSRTYTVTNQGELVTGMDFAFQSIPGIYDGQADIWGWNPWIGNNTHYQINYQNVGTETISGDVVLTLDPQTQFVSSTPANTSAAGQSVSWSVSNLLPGESVHINVTYLTDSTAIVTDEVTANVQFTITDTDQTPANNGDSITGHPTTSLDPNDKMVNESLLTEQDVIDGKPLEYVVRFQNTGTAPAVNIVVRDMIDNDLDLSTFEMIGATHPYSVWVEGNEIAWTFANILLPDSTTDVDASQGGFSYRIQPKATAMTGTIFSNRADIYFDYNEPVLTNTVETLVATPESIAERSSTNGLILHPSPGDGHLTLRWMNSAVANARITVFDAMGRSVHTANFARLGNDSARMLDLSNLPQGTYSVLVQGDGVNARTRFVIAH
ncbi:MAG: T9SS type A sorting domain-containing protein [Flavobacteriales bacterium]|nr:T9SS type A sorting domain-containing protein [Flavobacteriales bacterium]MBP7156763.1 T9SS type A sorting domain-containing protein [Flavobacteriales bacterium]HQV76401.1 hypothetical protein [Flavobacteriales bacterium]HQW42251.1 hypothetical protein [Flavobacteriales bacterium]